MSGLWQSTLNVSHCTLYSMGLFHQNQTTSFNHITSQRASQVCNTTASCTAWTCPIRTKQPASTISPVRGRYSIQLHPVQHGTVQSEPNIQLQPYHQSEGITGKQSNCTLYSMGLSHQNQTTSFNHITSQRARQVYKPTASLSAWACPIRTKQPASAIVTSQRAPLVYKPTASCTAWACPITTKQPASAIVKEQYRHLIHCTLFNMILSYQNQTTSFNYITTTSQRASQVNNPAVPCTICYRPIRTKQPASTISPVRGHHRYTIHFTLFNMILSYQNKTTSFNHFNSQRTTQVSIPLHLVQDGSNKNQTTNFNQITI
jgi:hypothetical protein